jgi:hypothetical protein
MPRIFDCVILSHWGEMSLLEKRFQAYQDNPDVTHVICECAADPDGNPRPACFKDGDLLVSDLAARWHGRWNHVKVEAHEITGSTPAGREACLREYLLHGFSGDPDDLIMFSDIRVVPQMPAGVPRGSITTIAELVT